jgi:hypothetical protein
MHWEAKIASVKILDTRISMSTMALTLLLKKTKDTFPTLLTGLLVYVNS